MNPEKTLVWVVVASIIGVILFSRFKACQTLGTGATRQVPWFWPCGSNAVSVTTASNWNGGQEVTDDFEERN